MTAGAIAIRAPRTVTPREPAWERAAGVLDRARSALLLEAMRAPPLAAIVGRRDARVIARSVVGIALAFAGAIVFPGALFVLSPLVLGVPHVGADVRYLMRRQGVAGGAAALLYGGCAAFLALRAMETFAPVALPYARVEIAAAATWIAVASLVAARDAVSRLRTAGVVLVTASLLWLAWPRPDLARVVFAHAHNLVAIAIWLGLFFRGRRASLVPVALLGLGLALILRGDTFALVARFHGYEIFGTNVLFAADQLAPRVIGALAPALVLSYVFLQSVHYMAWLAWIPESVTPAQGTLTFRMSARSLVRDFGGWWLALLAVVTAALLVGALFGAERARGAYLSLSAFHGYFELAALAYLVTRAGPPACGASCSTSSISG